MSSGRTDGRSTLVDERALLAEFRLEAAAYLDAALPLWRQRQRSHEPAVREAYLRAWGEPPRDPGTPEPSHVERG